MRHHKNRFFITALAAAMMLSFTACDGNYEPGEGMTTYIDTGGYNGPNLSDYVNEGLDEAKENGQYTDTDYSSILADGSTTSPSQDNSNSDSSTGTVTFGSENSDNFGHDWTNSDIPGHSMSDDELNDLMEYLAAQEYTGEPYIYVQDNEPYFADEDFSYTDAFEFYSELDNLGRVQYAYASLDESLMPADDEERGDISSIKPTGWVQAKYEGIGNGDWLYNRCHLIAWALAGENDNERNLMTGTRYFNVEGMLPFETQVMAYIDENPDNHVLYRSTPVYAEDDLLAKGLLLEAYSIEDNGELSFCIYLFNVQPGIDINYKTGESQKIM